MSDPASDFEALLLKARPGRVDYATFRAFFHSHPLNLDELCNTIALNIARRFMNASVSFEDADSTINELWSIMITGEFHGLPEPAMAIYEAFDAGEYDHGDKRDPVENYTKPLLQKILNCK